MDDATSKIFELALRDLGLPRVRLDQFVTVYHKAFPTEAMHPDMRQHLHDAIIDLVQSGAVTVPQGGEPRDEAVLADDPLSLPQALEIN